MTGARLRTEGWRVAQVSELFDVNPKKPAADAMRASTPVSFVPMEAVEADSGTIAQRIERPFGEVRKGYTAFRDGDVILAKITPCFENGKVAIARELTRGVGFGSSEFLVLRPKGTVIAEYLFHFLRQQRFRDDTADFMTGTAGQERVPRDYIASVELSYPDTAEQRKIVDMIERLLPRVSEARERIVHVRALLKRFRQSVLSSACSGTLTSEWRRGRVVQDMASRLDKAKATVQSRRSKLLKRRTTSGLLSEDIPEFPASWCTRTVGELVQSGAIVDFQDGNHGSLYPRKDQFGQRGVRFITAKQVIEGAVLVDEAPFLRADRAKQLRIGHTKPGDVLLTHNATVGRVAILPASAPPCILGTSVTYYRVNPSLLSSTYLALQMQSELWQSQLRLVMEQTTRNQVSVRKQAELWLAVPPPEEQAEITRRVVNLLALARGVEARCQAVVSDADSLSEAVLARAFTGQLVASPKRQGVVR